jgi:hypothetical protein
MSSYNLVKNAPCMVDVVKEKLIELINNFLSTCATKEV